MIGYTTEELASFAQNASIMAELVVGKTSLVRLAIRHGIPREVLIRDLHSHVGLCIAAMASDIDGAALVDAPSEPPSPPTRVRERVSPGARHPGPRKKLPA